MKSKENLNFLVEKWHTSWKAYQSNPTLSFLHRACTLKVRGNFPSLTAYDFQSLDGPCNYQVWEEENVTFLVWSARVAACGCLLVVCCHLLVVFVYLRVVCSCLLVVCGHLMVDCSGVCLFPCLFPGSL